MINPSTSFGAHIFLFSFFYFDKRHLSLVYFKVQWSIRSSNGNAGNDFAPFNTSLLFANGETSKDIQLSVVADSVPEIDEIFEVNLVSASNGAEINAARNKINFTVRYVGSNLNHFISRFSHFI